MPSRSLSRMLGFGSMDVSGAGGGATSSAGGGGASTSIIGAGSGASLGPQAVRPATKISAMASARTVELLRYISISFSDRALSKFFGRGQKNFSRNRTLANRTYNQQHYFVVSYCWGYPDQDGAKLLPVCVSWRRPPPSRSIVKIWVAVPLREVRFAAYASLLPSGE